MLRKIWYWVSAFVAALIIAGLFWTWLVVSYEPELTTDNTFVASDADSEVSNSSDDSLLSIRIDSGDDVLGWDQIGIALEVDDIEYPCSLVGLASVEQVSGKIATSLNADGKTFAVEVDATSEDSFTGLDLSLMKESVNNSHTIEFSTTDIFLGNNVTGMVVTNQAFEDIITVPNGTYNLDDSERLEWYDYDLSVHRVNAKNQVYVISEGDTTYKLQFISYYNEADESRYIQLIVGWLDGPPLPVFDDPNLIAESPCRITGAETSWALNQTISVFENGVDICNQVCSVKINIQYQGVNVKSMSKVEVV